MSLEPSRLRPGELIAGGSGVLLLAFALFLPWYGIAPPLGWTAATLGASTQMNGWDALPSAHWLILLTVLCAVALTYFQATRRAPAVPVTLSVIVTTLAALTVLVLIYRVLISVPGPGGLFDRRIGAYLGLVSAIGILIGAFASMRREGIRPADGPAEIETVRLQSAGGS